MSFEYTSDETIFNGETIFVSLERVPKTNFVSENFKSSFQDGDMVNDITYQKEFTRISF